MNTITQFLTIPAIAWGAIAWGTIAWGAIALGTALPINSFAQANTDPSKIDITQISASMTDGEVKKVDQEAGKVTIKHGEIKHLAMPGMTMVFTAKDKRLLTKVKPGDKVRFMVMNEGGKMVITDILPAG
jgi:Cu(I)/Ag(I) efflux system periplasmic protein CusF